MRIAFVHDYSPEHIGGTPTSMLEQKRALEKAGHTVYVFQIGRVPKNPSYDNRNFLYIKPQIVFPDSVYNYAALFGNPWNDRTIQELLKVYKIEVVHTQSELTLAYLVVRNANKLGIPVVSTIHSFYWGAGQSKQFQLLAGPMRRLLQTSMRMRFKDYTPPGNAVGKMFKNMTMNLAIQANVTISPSKHQLKDMKVVNPNLNVVSIPNPFRDTLKTKPKVVSANPHTFRLVWAGRVEQEKRPTEFMKAVKIAHDNTKIPFKVDVVGRGVQLQKIKKQFKLKNVTYYGQKSHADTVKIIDNGDAFFMSSYHFDNQPMVIAEALSRYRPVIYCDERLAEGVDKAGYLSKNETPEAMAQAIVDMVENPKMVQELSKKAKEASKIFRPEAYVKSIEKIYKSVTTTSNK